MSSLGLFDPIAEMLHRCLFWHCTTQQNDEHVDHFPVAQTLLLPLLCVCLTSSFFILCPLVFRVSCLDVSTPLGFGYRAKYIVDSAKLMHANGGEDWALDLRSKDREEVRAQLITLCGVGPKVLHPERERERERERETER